MSGAARPLCSDAGGGDSVGSSVATAVTVTLTLTLTRRYSGYTKGMQEISAAHVHSRHEADAILEKYEPVSPAVGLV